MRCIVILIAACAVSAGCDSGPYLTANRAREICKTLQVVGNLRAGDAALDSCMDVMNDKVNIRD